MSEDTPDRAWLRWVFAAVTAVVTIALLALLIGALVPRQRTGPVVGGVDVDELRAACGMVSGDDAVLCQRVARVTAAVDDGKCVAAEVQARPVLAASAEPGTLREQLKIYTQAQMDRCAAWDERRAQQ